MTSDVVHTGQSDARILTGRDPVDGHPLAVTVVDGRIAAIGPGPPGESAWLVPGLIDLQVNGFRGLDLNEDGLTPYTVIALTRALAATGVTTYVPTLVTASHDRISRALAVIAAARRADPLVAHAIPYAHLEGPHISTEDGPRGVHDEKQVRAPSLAEFTDWQDVSSDLVGMVTLSPHFTGAVAYTAALTGQGVHVAIGHTHAEPAQITAVVDAGARLCTHLGNGAHAVLPRHPNYLWTQLADDRLTAGFIADGHHLPADTLTAMIRAKGLRRSLLVSDAVALAGMPPGHYRTAVGGEVELTGDGALVRPGTPFLAGAVRGLADGIAQAVISARVGLAEAVALATNQPARFVRSQSGTGWSYGRGSLTVGADADLFRFHWEPGAPTLTPDAVWVRGTEIPTS